MIYIEKYGLLIEYAQTCPQALGISVNNNAGQLLSSAVNDNASESIYVTHFIICSADSWPF